MPISQSESGKAFEYAIAKAFSKQMNVNIDNNQQYMVAQASFNKHTDKDRHALKLAAEKSAAFLTGKDSRLKDITNIFIQSDQQGGRGDVRDVVLNTSDGAIGISAKQRHDSIKHPRLSPTIDFGDKWFGCPCSKKYFTEIMPVFNLLKDFGKQGKKFKEITNKDEQIYKPILNAFEKEIKRICKINGMPNRLLHFMIGKQDFYWVIKENGTVSVQSCNLTGSLAWGNKWKMPSSIRLIQRLSNSKIEITFDNGWQLNFRLHNAKSVCEPSLKFDVKLSSLPRYVSRIELDIHND